MSNCARHCGLTCDIFDARQEAMRALFAVAAMHKLIALPMQAPRSST